MSKDLSLTQIQLELLAISKFFEILATKASSKDVIKRGLEHINKRISELRELLN